MFIWGEKPSKSRLEATIIEPASAKFDQITGFSGSISLGQQKRRVAPVRSGDMGPQSNLK